MHPEPTVEVFPASVAGSTQQSQGRGWLVSPDTVVMDVAARDRPPLLPMHALIPAGAGAGRDERIDIAAVHTAADGTPLVALELARPAAAADPVPVSSLPMAPSLGGGTRHGDGGTRTGVDTRQGDDTVDAAGWLCGMFPSLAWCR